MAKPIQVVSAEQVVAACCVRWGESSALFEQVGNATGARARRHADLVAMGLWPSRGLWLEGVEVKVSRSDWLSELRQPDKADPIAKFCDFWWLAIGDEAIVKEGELPERWGLLVLSSGKLVCKKQAPQLEPEPLTRGFISALLRRARDAQEAIRRNAEREGFNRGVESAPQAQETERTNAEHELAMIKSSLAEFEKASGLKIDGWNGGKLGGLVARIEQLHGWRNHRIDVGSVLDHIAQHLDAQASGIRREAQMLRKEMRETGASDSTASEQETA